MASAAVEQQSVSHSPRESTSLQGRSSELPFLGLLTVGLVLSVITYAQPSQAMWVGFIFAGYAAVANDSMQTLGTFLVSNRHKPWWLLWLFVGGIFLATTAYSWWTLDGDVTYQRLAAKGFSEAPQSFAFLQVAAPLVLIVLTRFRMPVSTTFLLLSCFSTTASGVESVLVKSLCGYGVALALGFGAWFAASKVPFGPVRHPRSWRVAQWASTGVLWSVWLMQDAANIAVYLPRSLSVVQFGGFALIMVLALGLLMYLRGGRIQRVVAEKSDVVDVRAATAIDFVFAIILFVFKLYSKMPMSTTWVFIGLLAGRELAYAAAQAQFRDAAQANSGGALSRALGMLSGDLGRATAGLAVSLLLASFVNPALRDVIWSWVA